MVSYAGQWSSLIIKFWGHLSIPMKCDGHALLLFTCLLHQKKLYSVDHISGQRTSRTNQFVSDKWSVRDATNICSLKELIPALFYKCSWEDF